MLEFDIWTIAFSIINILVLFLFLKKFLFGLLLGLYGTARTILEQIKAADLNVITPVLIGNTADYSEIKILKEGDVSAGDEILSLA